MKEKETQEEPTNSEVKKVLLGVERATQEKEKSENGGYKETLEEEYDEKFEKWKKEQPLVSDDVSRLLEEKRRRTFTEAETSEGLKSTDFIKKWLCHPDYQPHNFRTDLVEITNDTEINVTPELIDYLLDEVKDFLRSRKQELSEISVIRFRVNSKDNTFDLLVKSIAEFGSVDTSVFCFDDNPPFALKKIDSTIFGRLTPKDIIN
jgi:hypothetical protein